MFRPFAIILFCFLCLDIVAQKIEPGVLVVKLSSGSPPSPKLSSPTQANVLSLTKLRADHEAREVIPVLKNRSSNQRSGPSSLDGVYRVYVDKSEDIHGLCQRLQSYHNVIYAEPVFQESLFFTPNDPDANPSTGNQTYLDVIKAYDAWDVTQGDTSIVIGIIDTGLDFTHDDIKDKIYQNSLEIADNGIDDDNNGYIDDFTGYDFADKDAFPQSDAPHGNRVGGIAGASTNNAIGIAGIGFNSQIGALKAFRSSDNSSDGTYDAIIYAADNGYDVLNLSWGSVGSFSQFNQDIINYAVLDKDVVVIAAAGNTPDELDFYPASYENVLSVSATNLDDTKAGFATYSYHVDLVAPGQSIYTTTQDNGYGSDNGTSYSTPMVAGTAALLRSLYPQLSAVEVMELIRVNTDNIYTTGSNADYQDRLGSGRLNMINALNRTNNKSVRLTSSELTSTFGAAIFFDDTVRLSSVVDNILGSTQNGYIKISTENEYFQLIKDSLHLGTMGQGDQLLLDQVIGYVSADAPTETLVELRFSFNDVGYTDFQYLNFTTEPNYLTSDPGDISLTVSGNGNLAYANDGFADGNGLIWNTQRLAQNIGIAIASSSDSIADNWPLEVGSNIRSRDFLTNRNIKYRKQDFSDISTYASFTDEISGLPMGLIIEQSSYAFEDSLAGAMILEYRLTNTNTDSIHDLHFGLYTNWNLGESSENRSYFSDGTIIADNLEEKIFTGLKIYADSTPIHQSIDLGISNGNSADIENSLTDSVKFALLSESQFDSAGFIGSGNDIASILSSDEFNLAGNSSVKIAFILAVSDSLEILKETIQDAEHRLDKIRQSPPLLASFVSCEGASQSIVPREGSVFNFYLDPAGDSLLIQDDSLAVGNIDNDTSFYVQNADSAYLADLMRIDLIVTDQVADFIFDPDTLYLDDPNRNLVHFADNSFLATDWLWDFGNGVQATIQHPSVNFTTPDNYTVTLTVNNELGCEGSRTKNLVVVNRPGLPDIEDIHLCERQELILNEEGTELRVYASQSELEPLATGTSVNLGTFDGDTSFFVSRFEDPFESLRKELFVFNEEIELAYSFSADTSLEETAIRLVNETLNVDSVMWTLADTTSVIDTLILPVSEDTLFLSVTAFNKYGCQAQVMDTLVFAQSGTPGLTDQQPCINEDFTLAPIDGTSFGFYSDPDLNQLLGKGGSIHFENVSDTFDVYIVGLDSILPSVSISKTIAPVNHKLSIEADPELLVLAEQRFASFGVSNSQITDFQWSIDMVAVDILPEIRLFFDTAGTYQLQLRAGSIEGCVINDTLSYTVLNHPPLSIKSNESIEIFPNPADRSLNVVYPYTNGYSILDLSGKTILTSNDQHLDRFTLNTSMLQRGAYILVIKLANGHRSVRFFIDR